METETLDDALALFEESSAARERGEIAEATTFCERSLALFERLEGDSPDTANILLTLGELRQALGDYDGAQKAAERAEGILIALTESFTGPVAVGLRVQALGQRGSILRHEARYDEAEVLLRQALELARAELGESDDQTAFARNNLGIVYKYTAQFNQAEVLYREALDALESEHGVGHPDTAVLYHNLGGLEHAREDYEKGEPLARRA